MRHLGRCLTFALLLAAACLPAGPALAAPPENSAAASPRLKYLPKDYWVVAEFDVGTVMKLAKNGAALKNPQYAQFQQYMELIKRYTSIDPETDLEWITFFAVGEPEDKKVLGVIQGSFKNDAVTKSLTDNLGDKISEDTYKKHKVFSVPNAYLCLPEPSTIIVGDENLVHGAIDQLGAKAHAVPKSLRTVLERTPGKSVFWAAVRPPVLLERPELASWREANADLYRSVKKIDCLSLSFDMAEDGLLIKGVGYVEGEGEAKNVHHYLSDRKKNLLHEEGTNVLYTSLLILSQLKTDGPCIEGSFRLTSEAFTELWDTKVIVKPRSSQGSGKGR